MYTSRIEICKAMAAKCQASADESPIGIHRDRMQEASDRFRNEADQFTRDQAKHLAITKLGADIVATSNSNGG